MAFCLNFCRISVLNKYIRFKTVNVIGKFDLFCRNSRLVLVVGDIELSELFIVLEIMYPLALENFKSS